MTRGRSLFVAVALVAGLALPALAQVVPPETDKIEQSD
jgi:hypothetical protein